MAEKYQAANEHYQKIQTIKIGDKALFENLQPKYAKEPDKIKKATNIAYHVIDVQKYMANAANEVKGEIQHIAGKDYLDKKDVDKILPKLQEEVLSHVKRYLHQEGGLSEEMEKFLKQIMLGAESELKRALNTTGRVNYDQIRGVVDSVFSQVRNNLLQGEYSQMENEDIDVVKEVGHILAHTLGPVEYQSIVKQLEKDNQPIRATQTIRNLDQRVNSLFQELHRLTEPEDKKEAA